MGRVHYFFRDGCVCGMLWNERLLAVVNSYVASLHGVQALGLCGNKVCAYMRVMI